MSPRAIVLVPDLSRTTITVPNFVPRVSYIPCGLSM
jgi:hypothetical protein